METIPFAAPAGGAALRPLRSRTRSNSRSPCPSSSPLPVRRHLPFPCCRLSLNGVRRRWGTSSLFPLRFRPRLLHGGSFAVCQAHGDHGHHHDEQIHDGHRGQQRHHSDHQHRYQDQHHQHHHHHHHHEGAAGERTAAEQAVMQFATAVGWVRLADFLRQHLQLCCCSMVLLLAAATSPYLLPRPVVKPFQDATILLAFPLVGISSALDAVLNISAGRVNIHVLMALAAFASVFMGNALEGGLLLAMFNLAHIAEEYFTSRAMIDVKELKDNHPEFALVLETNGDVHPQFSELKYTKIPVRDIKVGSYLLVRAGEAVPMDGEVYQGASTVTIEHLTGEAKPLERKVGDRIPGGARNLEGMMIIKSSRRLMSPWRKLKKNAAHADGPPASSTLLKEFDKKIHNAFLKDPNL